MKIKLLILCISLLTLSLFANTEEPEYSGVSNHIFWFVQITDTHISTAGPWRRNFEFAVGEGVDVVKPAFIVNSGDVTDGSPGENIWCTDGPRVEEWADYHEMLDYAGMEYGFYYDIAGNHDSYDDPGMASWTANSVVGQGSGMQAAYWTVNFSYGKYLFPDIMTTSNTGRLWVNDSDGQGFIIQAEADELRRVFTKHQDAAVIFAQGHHGLYQTNGYNSLVQPLFEEFGVQYYLHGHAHDLNYRYQGDVAEWRTDTLGHGDDNNFSVFAIDNNVISMTAVDANDPWPLIVPTAPAMSSIPKASGEMEPNRYAPVVPQCTDAPVRALIFDSEFVANVSFDIDGGGDIEMTQSNHEDALWLGYFDATEYSPGEYSLSITANGRTRTIKIMISDDECTIDPGEGDMPLETPVVIPGDNEIPDVEEPDETETQDADTSEVSDEDITATVDDSPAVDEDDVIETSDDDNTPSVTSDDDSEEISDENNKPSIDDGGCGLIIL